MNNKDFKWKIQSFVPKMGPKKVICVAYIDARQVADGLDALGVWRDEYRFENGILFCGISFKKEGEWVTRWDCGTESEQEKEKGLVSDAFKRAAVKWGVGRFLYRLGVQRLDVKQHNGKNYPCDNQGNILWDGEKLTQYINQKEGLIFVNQNQVQRLFTVLNLKFEPKKGENWLKNKLEGFGITSTKDLFLRDYEALIGILEKRPDIPKKNDEPPKAPKAPKPSPKEILIEDVYSVILSTPGYGTHHIQNRLMELEDSEKPVSQESLARILGDCKKIQDSCKNEKLAEDREVLAVIETLKQKGIDYVVDHLSQKESVTKNELHAYLSGVAE